MRDETFATHGRPCSSHPGGHHGCHAGPCGTNGTEPRRFSRGPSHNNARSMAKDGGNLAIRKVDDAR